MPYKDPEAARANARERAKRWRENHPERAREVDKRWKAANKELVAKRTHLHRAAHPEKQQGWNQRYYESNADREKTRAKEWRLANPEKRREYEHRRRALQKGGAVSTEAIYQRDNGRCHYCGGHVERSVASLDHLVPLSLGGLHTPENVRIAHRRCNFRRGTRGPAQLLLLG